MVDFAKSVASPQQAPPPATQLTPSEQNARTTEASAAPGDIASTQAVAQVGAPEQRGPSGPQSIPSAEDLNVAIAELRNSVARFNRSLEFAVDEATERAVVRVIDVDTDEVVRQIPSEEVLALAAQLQQLVDTGIDPTGLLLDTTA